MSNKIVHHSVNPFTLTDPGGRQLLFGQELVLIAGPCVMESAQHTLFMAEEIHKIAQRLELPFVFKASFDKANRSSMDSFRGVGMQEGLEIFTEVKHRTGRCVTTDLHNEAQVDPVAKVCDILQIPAFLCRQTDLIVAAGRTGRCVNVKKGQFLAPWDCSNIVQKLKTSGAENIILTERGTSFGYNNLVCDMRSISIMQALGHPVCFDASHSLQLPGGNGTSSGGTREHIPTLAKAAMAAGADILFIETHDCPEKALSDSATVFPLHQLEELLIGLKKIHTLARSL